MLLNPVGKWLAFNGPAQASSILRMNVLKMLFNYKTKSFSILSGRNSTVYFKDLVSEAFFDDQYIFKY